MRLLPRPFGLMLVTLAACWALPVYGQAEDQGWIDLMSLDAYRPPTGAWVEVGGVGLNPQDPKRLVADPGSGVLYNGPNGRTVNLVTRQDFGDVRLHVEFLIPKGSNAGVKFEGVYEVQIFDSWGVKTPTGSDCGGIYPRAELRPRYHHIDDGYPPLTNACKPPGQWQTMDVTWRAPRFAADGKKVANARFVQVVLNDHVVQADLEVATPTGNNWKNPEHPTGPLLFQADHGPVAFRNLRVRPLESRVP